MISHAISSIDPALDPRRIARLGVGSLDELVAMAMADPQAFAEYFSLTDPGLVIARLERHLTAEARSLLDSPEKIVFPINGVPLDRRLPADNPSLSSTEVAERDRLLDEVRTLRRQIEERASPDTRLRLADTVARLRTVLHVNP